MFHGYAQQGIVLYDSLIKDVVPYAHIYSSNGSFATVSNDAGQFELPDENNSFDTLLVSHVAYLRKILLRDSLSRLDTLFVTQNSTVLDEVVVFSEEAEVLIEDIMNLLKNATLLSGEAFYRQISTKNGVAMEWIETFYDLSYSENGVHGISIDQARFARKKYSQEYVFISHTNFSILTVGTQLFVPKDPTNRMRAGKPFNESFTNDYDFTISNVFSKDGDMLVEVNYKPNTEIALPVHSFGNFIYNQTQGKMVQYNATINHALGADQISYDGDRDVKMANPIHRFQVDFSEQTGKIEFIRVVFTYDLIEDEVVYPSRVTSSFVIYKKSEKPHKNLDVPTLMSEQVGNFETAKYKPKFWQDNPIIKRTLEEEAIISSFEKDNAFGTYFKK